MINGITKQIRHLGGQDGVVEVYHNIYGSQNIRTRIKLIDDINKVGIFIARQQIYLMVDEIIDIQVSGSEAYIVGNEMQIKIKVRS